MRRHDLSAAVTPVEGPSIAPVTTRPTAGNENGKSSPEMAGAAENARAVLSPRRDEDVKRYDLSLAFREDRCPVEGKHTPRTSRAARGQEINGPISVKSPRIPHRRSLAGAVPGIRFRLRATRAMLTIHHGPPRRRRGNGDVSCVTVSISFRVFLGPDRPCWREYSAKTPDFTRR